MPQHGDVDHRHLRSPQSKGRERLAERRTAAHRPRCPPRPRASLGERPTHLGVRVDEEDTDRRGDAGAPPESTSQRWQVREPARVSRPADRDRVRTARARHASTGGASAGCARGATRPCGSRGTAARLISAFVWPSAIRRRTSSSRGVRSSGGPVGATGVAASAAPSRRREVGLPRRRTPNGLDELGVRRVLQHVAACAGLQRGPRERRVLLHREDDDRGPGRPIARREGSRRATSCRPAC